MSFAARGALRGGRRGASALRTRLARLGDDGAQAGARAGDEASSATRDAARWWGTRGGAAAGIAGAGGLAYRQQSVWSEQADADQAQARADQLEGIPAELRAQISDNWDPDDGGGEDGILEQIRDAVPGVESVQDTIVLLVVAAVVAHFVMNRSNQLPNSPVVIAGGER